MTALLGLYAFSPLVSQRLDPSYAGGRSRDVEARAVRNTSAVGLMLGEFRTSMSDIMFIKTERYLHGGRGYKPHHEKQLMTVKRRDAQH